MDDQTASLADAAPLTIQVLRGLEAQAAGQRALASAVERSLSLIEAQDREILAEIRANREAVLNEQRSLCDAVRLQTAALDARTGLIRDLGNGTLGWLQSRWLSMLLGLGAGLGLAGAKQMLAVVLGQMAHQ
jgi:hypothetical protein